MVDLPAHQAIWGGSDEHLASGCGSTGDRGLELNSWCRIQTWMERKSLVQDTGRLGDVWWSGPALGENMAQINQRPDGEAAEEAAWRGLVEWAHFTLRRGVQLETAVGMLSPEDQVAGTEALLWVIGQHLDVAERNRRALEELVNTEQIERQFNLVMEDDQFQILWDHRPKAVGLPNFEFAHLTGDVLQCSFGELRYREAMARLDIIGAERDEHQKAIARFFCKLQGEDWDKLVERKAAWCLRRSLMEPELDLEGFYERASKDPLEFVSFEWERIEPEGQLGQIGMVVGSIPVMDHGQRPFRWHDPTRREGQKRIDRVGRKLRGPVPPGAVPCTFGSARRRSVVRLTIGPIWWQTGEADITPCPGDYLYSAVRRNAPADERMYVQGDWQLRQVNRVLAGKRYYPLGPLGVIDVGDWTFEYKQVKAGYQTPRFTQLFGSWFTHTFGGAMLELKPIRAVMMPTNHDWEAAVNELTLLTDEATIAARYDMVIERTPKEYHALLREAKRAALKEGNLARVDPCRERRMFIGVGVAADEEVPLQLYEPKA